jgi:hypothetical protein
MSIHIKANQSFPVERLLTEREVLVPFTRKNKFFPSLHPRKSFPILFVPPSSYLFNILTDFSTTTDL